LLYNSNDENLGKTQILIFSNEKNLNMMTICDNWNADETFSSGCIRIVCQKKNVRIACYLLEGYSVYPQVYLSLFIMHLCAQLKLYFDLNSL
jgi:hypothetical protein